ncbi:hypothetical protein P3W45_000323 [Vairimorpha bombi]|jgi:diadenosine tetraphosphatase ApaH/serine/threonine PP2A family protein phosphatase
MNLVGIFEDLRNGNLPNMDTLNKIIEEASSILVEESNVLYLTSPINVVGDLHGQYYDFLKILDLFGMPCKDNKYLFLGDYVDRGLNSVEIVISVLILKILYKNEIFLLRGNHESKGMGINYTFRDECRVKYNDTSFLRFCEIFTFLPVCAIIDDRVLCIHGGLTPNFNIEVLKLEDRFEELPVFHDIYWSDPDEYVTKYEESSRGAGYLFGEDDTNRFLHENNLQCIVRSHQLVESGFDSKFGGKVLTVWSAPNYVYTHENGASILFIEDDMLIPKYFDKAEPQYVVDKMYEYYQKNLNN